MPFTQFDLTIKWQAVSCQVPAAGEKPSIKVNISAEAVPKIALEPNRLYPADPRSLTGWSKTGEVTFEWQQNRMLKSANGSADDQAGQAAVNIASGVDLQSRFSLTVATELAAFLPYVPDLDKLAPAKNQGSNSKACTSYAIASTLEDRLLLETPSIAFPVSPLYGHLCIAGKPTSSPWDPDYQRRGNSLA
ncbi:hypothetical protein [Pseudomonas fluorescens]|nr:hypothetical protein [Pseudomonas fluorescens]